MFVDKTVEIKMKEAPLQYWRLQISLSSVLCSVSTLCAQAAKPEVGCSPVSLELVVGENGETNYKLSGKPYVGYPLDDLRESLSEM